MNQKVINQETICSASTDQQHPLADRDLDREYQQKSKTQFLIVADQVVNDGCGNLLVSMANASAIVLHDRSEVKRIRSRGQALRPVAARDDWYFLEDALSK